MKDPPIRDVSEAVATRLAEPGPSDLATLVRFSASMLQQESLDDLLWSMAERIGLLLDFEDCVIYLREGDELVQVAAYGLKNPVGREIFEPISIPIGRGIVGRVARSGHPVLIADVSREPDYIPDQVPGLSELAVPILYEGRVIGVIDSESPEIGAFDDGDLAMLQWIATIAAPRIASAKAEQQRAAVQLQLQEAKQNLERRVEERTHELSETVGRLREEVDRRAEVERALEVEKGRAQTTLQAIGEGVISTDADGRIILINEAACSIVGLASDQAVGRPVQEVFDTAAVESIAGPGDTSPPTLGDLLGRDCCEDGCGGARGVLRRLRRADGEERFIVKTASVMCDAEGANRGLVVVFRDVTQRQRLEEEVRRSQRLESLGELAGGIAHDFNNMLQAIHGNLSLALISEDGSEDREEALAAAEDACRAASTLPNQLLALARGGAPVKSRGASLRSLIHDAVDFSMHGSAVACDVSIPPDLAPADIDEGQISQVIQNLVINACHAMNDRGRISVEAHNILQSDAPDAPVHSVAVSVEDTGVGIEAADLERIFDPYYTTKPEGSGLGLTTSYWIARRHGGSLDVTSEPGVGTRFTLTLPASESTESVDSGPEEETGDDRPARILVMDDEPGIRSFVEKALKRLGHEVEAVPTGEEAVERIREAFGTPDQFRLVLLDLTVPGAMGGGDALPLMQEIDPGLHAIVMSGYSHDPILASHEEYGFHDKLPKPFTMDALGEVVAGVLAQVSSRR